MNTKQPKHTGDTRQRILEAARLQFSRSGFDGTSMSTIATDVGIKKPSLYHFFSSKEELYITVIDEIMSDVAHIYDVDPSAFKDIRAAFIRTVSKSIRYGIEHGAGILSHDLPSCQCHEERFEKIQESAKKMHTSISSFLKKCGVDDHEFVAQVLTDSNQMYLMRSARKHTRRSTKNYIEHMADLLLGHN